MTIHWSEANVEQFLATYEALETGPTALVERARRSLMNGMTPEYFEEKKARYNKLVRNALGFAAEPYCLHAFGRRPRTRFGLRLPAEARPEELAEHLKREDVVVSVRGDALRVSPHLYNDRGDVEALLEVLRQRYG